MEYKRYQKIRRVGTSEVQDLLEGRCYIFPKIDGTNASVWLQDGVVNAGSRNRHISIENDNAGFCAYAESSDNIRKYLKKHPDHRLYGEWLIPHSLKTYRSDAWRKFYIFDVIKEDEEGNEEYLTYENYQPLLEEFDLEYIPPIAIINNPTIESLHNQLDKTGFLVEDGKGNGEGIVIKNYDFYNQYGRQTWGKIVTNEFKEKAHKVMGTPEMNTKLGVEERIVNEFCTEAFVEKEFAKFVLRKDGWEMKYVKEFINRLFKELIDEEMYNIIKTYKNPTINFKLLQGMVTRKFKQVKKDIF